MTDEDKAFKYIEKKIMQRKRAFQAVISKTPYRDQVIEEVAKEIEKLTGFGKDTIDSLTIYIRNMKNERKDRAG
jgi:CHASE3 domain sensor protein